MLYDPLSNHIINGILSNCNESERKNLYTLLEQTYLENTILLLNRGYPGKEVYRFLSQHKLKYVIRMGIGNSNPRYIRGSINADQISTDIKNPDITHRIIRFIKVFLFYLPQLLHDTFRRIEIIHKICMLLKEILFPVRDGRSFSRKKKHTDRKYCYNLK